MTSSTSIDKNTKKIFSHDESPLTQKADEHHTHTDENGDGDCDGVYVQPQTMSKGQDEFKQIFTRSTNSGSTNSSTSLNNMHFCITNNPSPLEDWKNDDRPKLKAKKRGRRLEVLPSPVPLSAKELQDLGTTSSSKLSPSQSNAVQCKAHLSSSSLILRKGKRVFGNSIEIKNPTSLPYGFKVSCNRLALLHLSVKPKMGVVQPDSKIVLSFTSKGSKSSTANDRIEIKTFEYFTTGDDNLKDYYNTLLLQHPELIKTQTIKRIILWDSGDLSDLMKMLDSVPNSQEREVIRKELISTRLDFENAENLRPPKDIIPSVKRQLLIANQLLQQSFHQIAVIRRTQNAILLCFCGLLSVALVLPFLLANAELDEPEPVPEPEELTYFEQVKKFCESYF